jgi:hypothetical protein
MLEAKASDLNLQHLDFSNIIYFVGAMIENPRFLDSNIMNEYIFAQDGNQWRHVDILSALGNLLDFIFAFIKQYSKEHRLLTVNRALVFFLEALLRRFTDCLTVDPSSTSNLLINIEDKLFLLVQQVLNL